MGFRINGCCRSSYICCFYNDTGYAYCNRGCRWYSFVQSFACICQSSSYSYKVGGDKRYDKTYVETCCHDICYDGCWFYFTTYIRSVPCKILWDFYCFWCVNGYGFFLSVFACRNYDFWLTKS